MMHRLRSLGLLALFLLIFGGINVVLGWLGRTQDMVISTAISLIAALIAGWLLLHFAEYRPLGDLGFGVTPRTRFDIGAGLLIPILALLIVTLVLVLAGAVTYSSDAGGVRAWIAGNLGILIVLAIPAAAEEALFRGYPFQKLVEVVGPVAATLVASAGFAIAHRHNPGVNGFALANIFLAGVMLSIAFLRTRSLWFATAVHLGWNWQMAGPLDLPVSGLELFDTPLYEPHMRNAVLSGGSFGPEGGISGLVALLLVTAGVWFYTERMMRKHD
jgi:uncharacterized protein